MKTLEALANYLEISTDELQDNGDGYVQVIDGSEYLVLTEEEADKKATEYIEDSLWAFNAEFILEACGLDCGSNVSRSLRQMQEGSCEGCNDFVRALVDGTCGIDEFVNQAVLADGRGNFLSPYDGEEVEQNGYLIYRID